MRPPIPFLPILSMLLLAALMGCGSREAAGPLSTEASGAPLAAGQPNVVIIIIDTLRADQVGAYGGPAGATPELDALAARGVRFDRVIAQSPWTRPSIGTMLTGCYPRTLGIYDEMDQALDGRFTTLAEALKAAGYTTLGVHSNPNINAFFNFHQGFDEYIDSEVWYGFMHPEPGQRRFGKTRLASARELFDEAFGLIEEHPAGPHYLQFVLMDVHEWCRGEYDLTREEFREEFAGSPNAEYLAPLRQVSLDIQAFIDRITALAGWDNTLFIITADHGEGLNSHPGVERSKWHGRLLYESQLWVPQVWWNPAWPEGTGLTVARPVRLIDLAPTLLDYLGLPVPEGAEGVSVAPLFTLPGAEVALPEYFVAETELRDHHKAAVYGAAFNYIEAYDDHGGTAPRELQGVRTLENGAATSRLDAQPEVAEALARHLASWEAAHPKAAPVAPGGSLSEEAEEQLRAIGYLGD